MSFMFGGMYVFWVLMWFFKVVWLSLFLLKCVVFWIFIGELKLDLFLDFILDCVLIKLLYLFLEMFDFVIEICIEYLLFKGDVLLLFKFFFYENFFEKSMEFCVFV